MEAKRSGAVLGFVGWTEMVSGGKTDYDDMYSDVHLVLASE